jgi:hypothetical protein
MTILNNLDDNFNDLQNFLEEIIHEQRSKN